MFWTPAYYFVVLVVVLLVVVILMLVAGSNASGIIKNRRRLDNGQWTNVSPEDTNFTGYSGLDPVLYATGQPVANDVLSVSLASETVNLTMPPALSPKEEDYLVTAGAYDAFLVWGSPTKATPQIGYRLSTPDGKTTGPYVSIYDGTTSGPIDRPTCWILTSNANLISAVKNNIANHPDCVDFPDKVNYRVVPLFGNSNSFVLDMEDDSGTTWHSAEYNNDTVGWTQITYSSSLNVDEIDAV